MVFKSPFEPVEPDAKFKGLVSNFFWHKLDEFAERTLFVDFVSGREWTGGQIKEASGRVAANLIERCALLPNSDCVTFYYNCDHLQLLALGLLFAGASVCAGAPEDPEAEHAHMLDVMRPALVAVGSALAEEMLRLRQASNAAAHFQLLIMDDDQLEAGAFEQLEAAGERANARIFGYHRHLLAAVEKLQDANDEKTPKVPKQQQLPVQVDPERPAFILLTSGSTGRPKPVNRSQRNSLYVCVCLEGEAGVKLWRMDERSVLAGHLQLDHGTGTFCLKQTLAKGLKLIIMHGYEYSTLLEATRCYGITDVCLGSALLHNFATTALAPENSINLFASEDDEVDLGSLRNLLAVGSPIASERVVQAFMARFKGCSIRQAYGMTECGFVAVEEPRYGGGGGGGSSKDMTTKDGASLAPVGVLLPNLVARLVDRESGAEINELKCEGELEIAGPTVSPGYLGARFEEQARAAFLQDGFYKTNDICQLLPDGQLCIRGRYSEILCLHDGWKVLPSELEQALVSHPLVQEAAVIGVPHPRLPTCHAPRAYVVPKPGVPADFDAELERRLEAATAAPERKSAQEAPERASKDGKPLEKGEQLTEALLFEYTAKLMSEPKHLVGGIRLLHKLPRISIGKFDKKLLRKLDGFA